MNQEQVLAVFGGVATAVAFVLLTLLLTVSVWALIYLEPGESRTIRVPFTKGTITFTRVDRD